MIDVTAVRAVAMASGDGRGAPRPELVLGKNPVFAKLSQDTLQGLVDAGRLHRYRAHALVFVQGDPADEVFCVIEGRVSVFATTPDGRDQLYAFLEPGELFGELGVLGDMPRSATVEALEDCTLWGVRRETFLRFVEQHPMIARELLQTLARKVVALDAVAEDLVVLDLKGRVAKRLLELAGNPSAGLPAEGIALPWQVSQTQLASLCGATRENVSRVLSEFQRRGVVQRTGRRYVLHDLETLRRLAGL